MPVYSSFNAICQWSARTVNLKFTYLARILNNSLLYNLKMSAPVMAFNFCGIDSKDLCKIHSTMNMKWRLETDMSLVFRNDHISTPFFWQILPAFWPLLRLLPASGFALLPPFGPSVGVCVARLVHRNQWFGAGGTQ